MTDLQRASLGKRIMAAIFDGILLATLAVGIAALLSLCFKYDVKFDRYSAIMDRYEQQYELDIQAPTDELTDAQKAELNAKKDALQSALLKDDEFMKLYSQLTNLRMLMLSFGILGAVLMMELLIPLLFGNGQTLGKKIFGIGIMHLEGVRITGKQVFIRSVLGKYSVELMLPIYILTMTLTGDLGLVGWGLLAVLVVTQIVCVIITRTNAPIHDILASTVAVDFASQHIFEDIEERDNYIKQKHAEYAAHADY